MHYRHWRQVTNQRAIDSYDDFWACDNERFTQLWESTDFIINPVELGRNLMDYDNLKRVA